jgi:6-phosphogluconolactonase
MGKISRSTPLRLACLLAVGACNSNELRDKPQDASDVAQTMHDASGDRADDADTPGSLGDGRVGDGQVDASADAAGLGDAQPRDAAVVTIGEKMTDSFLYVGGYGKNYPLRTYVLDRSSGALTLLGTPANLGDSPSYLAHSADGTFLYAANEEWGAAGVTAAAIDATTALPSNGQREPYAGKGLVFTEVAPNGKFVLATSYDGGELVVYPIESDGKLGPAVDKKSFGDGAQTHSVRVHPSGKWAYAPNKGLDKIAQFSFDEATGKLTALTPAFAAGHDGPRHLAFSPDGKRAYVMHELDNQLTSYEVGSGGALTQLDSKSALPPSFKGESTGAHVLVHKSGKFVYASTRGADVVTVFATDEQGKLTPIESTPTLGKVPRNFDIDPSGAFLVVANQGKDNAGASLVVFAIGADGKLTPRGTPVTDVQSPCALSIVNRAKR